MTSLSQDVRYAWRTLRNHMGFALIVVAALAFGHRSQHRHLQRRSLPCFSAPCRFPGPVRLVSC